MDQADSVHSTPSINTSKTDDIRSAISPLESPQEALYLPPTSPPSSFFNGWHHDMAVAQNGSQH